MENYFLKSAACLAILMLFYKLLLEKENMHVFKRFYLLAAVVVSFIIPWVTFTTYIEPVPVTRSLVFESGTVPAAEATQEAVSILPVIMWSLYGLGILFFGIKFFINLKTIFLRIKRNPKHRSGRTTNVLLQENIAPHTFWNYIFLNKKKFQEQIIPAEVFEHEKAHAVQKHSVDILFMELLLIIFWFHPLLYLVKKAVRLNHEFLADQAVIRKGVRTATYQETLLAFSSGANHSSLVNSINYSSIKKRFTVMKTKTSRRTVLLRSTFILPLLAGLIYGFSTTEQVQKPITETGSAAGAVQEQAFQKEIREDLLREYDSLVEHYNRMGDNAIMKQKDLERMDAIYNLMTAEEKQQAIPRKFRIAPPPIPAEWSKEKEATLGMIEEYNKLARRYGSRQQKLSKSRVYDFLRMKHIHSLMTDEQKMNAEPLPDLLPLPQQTTVDSTSNTGGKRDIPEDGNLVIAEDINVHILKDGNLVVNNKVVKPGRLEKRLNQINTHLSPEHQRSVSVDVWVEPEVPMEQTKKVEKILRSYGLSEIRIILKSLIDVPEEDYFHHFEEEPVRSGKFELRKF